MLNTVEAAAGVPTFLGQPPSAFFAAEGQASEASVVSRPLAIAVLAERHPFAVLLVMVGHASCQRLSVITAQQVCLGIKGFETIIGAHTLLT
ncbi:MULTISPECIES: hypothetical protein [unclassified Ensifer]|uniref:hypothetical protein n=1 Tax=unclassified Ensifer TaxID=2633371 RepID=UPI0030101763